jgi:NAD(P)-dependent dehydrogenase (short-subunit alcohol dehydrogenase family)
VNHVIVTGAAHGIGAAIAIAFARRGDLVTLVDRDEALIHHSAARIQDGGGLVGALLVIDLSLPDSAELVIEEAWQRAPVDVLVSAAGIYPSVDVLDLDAEVWDRVQSINTRAPMLLTAALARRAVQEGRSASIVNISSGAAARARPGGSAYSTSKAALEAATRAAALELAAHGIRVNAVAPGFIAVASELNPVTDEYARAVGQNPLGRPGTPEDVARAVLWIAGDDASWVTGETIRVDGGSGTGAWTLPRLGPSSPQHEGAHR